MKHYKIKCVNSLSFDELDKEAQNMAVMEHVKFLLEIGCNDEQPEYFVNIAADNMEKMRTPWFLAETLYFDYRKEIEEEIRVNEYEFFSDGTFFSMPRQFCAVVQS